jgi:DNA helicase HerA-like ATPase
MSGLFLGENVDPAAHSRNGKRIELDPASFTTHGVIVGQTGSGKTGLGMVLIEEALRAGIPTLLIDPKGDLTNLALTFAQLRTEDFAPWVEGDDAAKVADTWTKGLHDWGIEPTDVATAAAARGVTIYTPGSNAGVGLNLIGSLRAPTNASDDAESRLDEVGAIVGGLLGLMGIDSDPLSSREHILLTNLIDRSWSNGQDLDLATLVAQIQQPPVRKLGVLEVDTFYPPKDRNDLAMKLNGLLASPSFASWNEGESIDIDAILHLPDGRPRAAVITLSHLSDEERQFAVAIILGKLISWMRRQPGTSKLRALIYFDEVFGFVPPTAMPPAKKPILTLLKQARAFGVGLVLATQNPVDVDYKALSNATTWMIGRLQTERDRDRLLDGMRSAAGGVDIETVAATISGLAKREFVLHRSGTPAPEVFTSRWTMAYLRGPLTREQIKALAPAGLVTGATTAAQTPIVASTTNAPMVQSGETSNDTSPMPSTMQPNAPLASDEVPIAPQVAQGTTTYVMDPAAPWAGNVGAVANSRRHQAGLVARVNCLFDDTKSGIHIVDEWEAIFTPISRLFDASSAIHVDYDARDLNPQAPNGATFVLPEAPLNDPVWFRAVSKLLTEYLLANHSLPIYRNQTLKAFSRIGESKDDFLARCDVLSQAQADTEAAALTTKLRVQIDKINSVIDEANRKVDEIKAGAKASRTHELIAGAGDLLGALFGGRRNVRSITRSIGSAAARHGRAEVSSEKVATAQDRVSGKLDELHSLETQLHDEVFAIDAKWDEVGRNIEEIPVTLERSDISIVELAVVWIPA